MKNQIFNPFLPLNKYIPDGEPHIFGDRIYLFGSHDKEGVVLKYQVENKNKQELSIRFFGKGKLDLYSLNFKEKI